MLFRQLFDPETSTYSYLLADETTREAVLIDPVQEQVDRDLALVHELGLSLRYTLETHVHADHVTGSGRLRELTGAKSVVSRASGVSCADVLVEDGQELGFGRHRIKVISTPGHTDGCVSYLVDGAMVFTGDALLIRGSGRTDFQGGSSEKLYDSVKNKLFGLPPSTAVYPGHDYKGRTTSTILEEREHNPRLGGTTTLEQFKAIMEALRLDRPKKIDEAVPANLSCGRVTHAAEPESPKGATGDESFLEEAGAWRSPEGYSEVSVGWATSSARVRGFKTIDVRSLDEFHGELGHLPGAELVPLETLAQRAQHWRRDLPLVLVCRSGKRSGRAAAILEGMGFSKVVSMAGGMLAVRSAQ